MHYKAMGDLGYTGSLNDRIHKYLTEEYGSFYEALRDLRNGTSVFSLISSYVVNSFDPALVFDFKQNYYRTGGADSTLSSSVTHTRASSATMTNSSGTLVTVGNNVPRTDHHSYNGSAWVNEGLLHESEARTNLLTYSEDFSNAAYGKTNCSVTSNATIAPDGTTTADKLLIPTTDNSFHFINQGITMGSVAHTVSVFFKAGEITSASIFHTQSGNNGGSFNLSTGVATASGTGNTASMVDVGNGWYHCSVTNDGSASVSGIRLGIGNGALNSFVGVIGQGIFAWGAQLEAGSTPSSYIPTTGSTATRAAEALTVPAANMPWPTPVVIGSELITNGTFDTDTSGWTVANNASLSVDSNRLKVTATQGYGGAFQEFTTVTGKTYIVTANFTYGDIAGYLQILDRNGGGYLYDDWDPGYSSDTSITGIFTAVSNLTRVLMLQKYGGSGNYSFWDNVSVKEINPLSVSIQMDGRMTYADEGIYSNVVGARWRQDSSNTLSVFDLSTNSTDTGRPFFTQENAGVYDAVSETGTGSYFPGINVPFNVASRHGSTFINGAVEGTALTANTTPLGLHDLSTTNLELGYDFMGTIGKFRVWSDDLTDTGIEEAST